MFFDPRRYDLVKVGRYKFNKKLHFKNRLKGQILAEAVSLPDPETGEVVELQPGTELSREAAEKIQNAAIPYVWVQTEERNVKVLSSMMVDFSVWCPQIDPNEVGIRELVYYPALKKILEENEGADDDELKTVIRKNVNLLIPKHITKEDIFASIN